MVSDEGVQQGDPLGPLLFSLAIFDVCQQIQSVQGVGWSGWYLDDGNLAGTLAALTESMAIMNEGLQAVNVQLNFRKCKLWSPCPSGIPSVSWASFVDYDSEITVLGCPFGSATSIETALEKKRIELGRLWEQLRTIPDTEVALTLLRHCLGACKVNHLLRCLPTTTVIDFASQVGDGLYSTMEALIGSALSDQHRQQCCLPVRNGGVGLTDPASIAPFAYIASALGVATGGLCPFLSDGNAAVGISDAVEIAIEILPTAMIDIFPNACMHCAVLAKIYQAGPHGHYVRLEARNADSANQALHGWRVHVGGRGLESQAHHTWLLGKAVRL